MRNLVLILCSLVFSCFASESSREKYLELVKHYPNFIDYQGDFSQGEIQIILDPQEMASIEQSTSREMGVIMEDRYWLWVNDACIFPNGNKGVYGRILWRKSLEACPGVVVMPVLPDGKIVLNCNFRHATRSWEIELPRGLINPGEEIGDAARRETMEETGMLVDYLTLLGKMSPDTGLTNSVIPIFMAKVIEKRVSSPEDSEAIAGILALTVQEIKEAFVKGYYECDVKGVQRQVSFRDPFLAYAILMFELKNDFCFIFVTDPYNTRSYNSQGCG